ncbi:MAG: eukaryotic-like serine/threonine-protein kinase, partial [Frankiales bacterium]|nr:eukaryotic-like serine/threonine-protein kinase [Frankiales bacterium]
MAEPRRLGGRYEIGPVLGYGGMAEVLRGRDVRLGRDVAVKILRPDLARDPAFQARFRREAQSAASLNHPSIVAVYDTGEDTQNGITTPYIVMEYVEGRTLREVLQTEGGVMPARALEIVAGVCSALQYSHAAGIIHRDIKPANVMLTPDGAIKVMDFGIARAVTAAAATMTQTAAVIGTAQYLSPEQARAEVVDARSDIYSTGCLLYELLTGRPPFVGDSPVSVAYQHVREDAVPPSALVPDIEPSVDAIVMKALAKNPANRYQTAAEMQADITRALSGRPVLATPVLIDEQTQVIAPPAVDATMTVRPARPEHRVLKGLVFLLLFGAVGAMVFGGVYELRKASSPGAVKTAIVPNVLGLSQAEADQQVKAKGFNPVDKLAHNPKPKNTVFDQSPVPLAEARPGSDVTISVSSGPAPVPVPPLVGATLDGATTTLQAQGLVVGPPAYKDGPIPKNQVISSNPASGVKVAPGTPVQLTLGSGMAVVPNVIGKTKEEATQLFLAAGLGSPQVTTASGPQPPDTVRYQSVWKGKLPLGTVVDLTVST